jgi:DNA topoisomerase-1
MARLRRVSPNSKGWSRRRAGRGFTYLDEHGRRLGADDVARCKELVIPPAWDDVWICPDPTGHLQAVGVDDAGRRQYLYHPEWREKQDRQKHERVTGVAAKLPQTRKVVLEHLGLDGMPLERAAATAVRLLDLGYFRIGNDVYADAHGSFGLTTLEKRHVRRRAGRLLFRFTGKSGMEHSVEIEDPPAVAAVETMRRRRSGGEQLLAYRASRTWTTLDPETINDYLRTITGAEVTAKDFRTWHATVLAAVALATTEENGDTKASRKRAVREAMREVSEYLGNTPTMARSSYVDPRVVDLYEDGTTIAAAVRRRHKTPESRQAALERAVLRMLRRPADSRTRAARSR